MGIEGSLPSPAIRLSAWNPEPLTLDRRSRRLDSQVTWVSSGRCRVKAWAWALKSYVFTSRVTMSRAIRTICS